MRRRQFITLLGGAAAWPLAARAQQPAVPVIGYLNPTSPDTNADLLRAFRQGLRNSGHVEGENVAILYRWADTQVDRLPELAADLVRRSVTVIAVTGGAAPALAVKAATATIPSVFVVGEDPVKLGLVSSLARPEGNLTGVNFFTSELAAKRLELLREMLPAAERVAVLVDRAYAADYETGLKDLQEAARSTGFRISVLSASSSQEIDAVFAGFAGEKPDALFVGTVPFFFGRRTQLAHLALRHGLPAIYTLRPYVVVGGLMSYGTNVADAYHQAGAYVGRILKGAAPGDLPVVQSTKFELVINAQTARILGLSIPPTLLARADEVIE